MVHIGIIPDGNRRWCQKNNINFYNHNNDIIVNYEKIIIDFINKHEYLKNKKRIPKHLKNITEVSFYISSIDNMKRIDNTKYIVLNLIKYIYEIYKDPKQYLDKMNIDYTDEQYNNINNIIQQINIDFIGEIDILPIEIQDILKKVKRYNKDNKYSIHFAIAYDYFKDIQSYKNTNYINYIRKQSDIDLIFRTGGEYRTSGFFPTKTIYSELFILKKLWPEVTFNDFKNVLRKFNNRSRRFGK